MSHEFKTPIATINLAIDAIENPINIKDEKKSESLFENDAGRE